MADAGTYPKLQRLGSEVQQKHSNASKFYYHFLFKAVTVSIFLVILPLFSSQTPDFVNQIFHTRSWELLQLVFVGIAVSYGLFSKRSEEPAKEHSPKFDNAQTYISKLLQVSSVFDDEAENPSAFDESKVQTWNSQYYRGEPVVVVAKEGSVHQEQRGTSSLIGEKPLLLPVRSLRSRVLESDLLEPIQDNSGRSASLSRSCSGSSDSSRFSSKANISRSGDPGITSPQHLEQDAEIKVVRRSGSKQAKQARNEEFGGANPSNAEEVETVVHRSPIPWRSRSGRMEMKEDTVVPSLHPTSTSPEEPELDILKSHSFRSLSSRSSGVDSNSPSPNKLSPSRPSLISPRKISPSSSWSVESQAKGVEDFGRKKSFHKSSPPPPPPPPPPPFLHKSPLAKSSLSMMNNGSTLTKELRRSAKSVPMEFSNKWEELPRRANLGSENQFDASVMGRSVRTIRPSEALDAKMRPNDHNDDFIDGEREKWSTDIENDLFDKKEYSNKLMQGKSPSMTRQTFMQFPANEKEQFLEKVLADTETESEEDYFEGSTGKEEISLVKEETSNDSVSDDGPDVDKKADEFIAKFREQIRLQRIESIRRSAVQHTKNRSR